MLSFWPLLYSTVQLHMPGLIQLLSQSWFVFSYVETNFGGITGTLKMTKSWSMHDIGSYLEGGHLKWWPFWIFTWLTLLSQIMNQSVSTCKIGCLYHHLINRVTICPTN